MNDKDAKKLERLTERYKKNNEKIKQNYDRVSIALPKGTKDRIKATGDTLNNFIINAVMEKLKAAEADLQQAAQEATQDATPGARTNRHEATKSRTGGRTEAQEGTTSAGAAEGSPQEEPKPRSRSRKASGANRSPQETTGGSEAATPAGETTGGPEEGTTAGSPQDAQPVEAADAAQHLTPGDNLQQFNPYKYNSENVLLYPYGMDDDIPPEELPFH